MVQMEILVSDLEAEVDDLATALKDAERALADYRHKAHALSEAILGPGPRLDWYKEALLETASQQRERERLQDVIETALNRVRLLREELPDDVFEIDEEQANPGERLDDLEGGLAQARR
jgi:predicted  nucleic acid-binding Zn-ribbon protein